MQGKKDYQEKLFTNFQLSSHIPQENFYRKLLETIDFSFLYKDTKVLYGNTGNPSIDPVVFFKLILTGYLENITSDRKLVEHCSMRMDILYFLGYDIDEELPWHSTISRSRQLYPISLFETLFNKVFSLCVDAGLVSGHTQAVDSAPVKANASMESLALKVPVESVGSYLKKAGEENSENKKASKPIKEQYITAPEHQLKRVERHQQKLRTSEVKSMGASNKQAQLVSNKTHYNPHDPDARISVKPGKARKLNYHCSMVVDTAQGVISHVQADFADGRDSQYLPGLINKIQYRLQKNELILENLLADTGYSNGFNYHFLAQRNITAWIPVFGRYKPEIEGFPYDREKDQYTCSMGKSIPFKGFNRSQDGSLLKNYWSAHKDCKNCPLKTECIPNSNSKKINRSAYGDEYQRAYSQQHSKRGKQMKRLRQSTVEPVFGSLVHYYGLSKIGVIGRPGAHKVMMMSAIAFNLKKYMKFRGRKTSENLFKSVQKAGNHKYEPDSALVQKFVVNLN